MSWTHGFGEIDQGLGNVSLAVAAGVVLGSYCIGCVSTGYYLVKARTGKDIRQIGTGSTGARNVSRVLGSSGFALTLGGDLAKGGVAVWLASILTNSQEVELLSMMAVTLGHVWPAQLRFQGGKGTATSLAGLLIYNPWFALIYCVTFAVAFALTRKAVACSLIAYVLLPVGCYFFTKSPGQALDISVLALVVLVAHYRNVAEGIHYLLRRRNFQAEPELPEI